MSDEETADLRENDGIKDGVLTFYGETFSLPDRTGSMALMRYAHLAEQDEITDMQELAAIYSFLEATVSPADWDRFQKVAIKHRASTRELIHVAADITVAVAAHPTSRSSDSSDGPPAVVPSSSASAAERVIARLDGRPDLQNVVAMRQRAQAS